MSRKFRRIVMDLWYKGSVVYFVGAVIFAASQVLDVTAPLFPLNYYSLVWMMGLFFPLTATTYFLCKANVRLDEIQDLAERLSFHRVYGRRHGSDEELREDFERFIRTRFHEYYNWAELVLFSLVAGGLVFTGGFFLVSELRLVQFGDLPSWHRPFVPDVVLVPGWLKATASSFIGAVAGSFVLLLKRYRSFDVYPTTYLQIAVGVVSATLAASFVVGLYPSVGMNFLGFGLGFLTALNVAVLTNLVWENFRKVTGTPAAVSAVSDLSLVIKNPDVVDALHNLSVFSIAEFVSTDPIRLYLNLGEPAGVINNWLDEALLHYHFGSRAASLAAIHLHLFTLLLKRTVGKLDPLGNVWPDHVPLTGDKEADGIILQAMKTIVEARTHHRLLGVLSSEYRDRYFSDGA
jgi:hypothetical protein